MIKKPHFTYLFAAIICFNGFIYCEDLSEIIDFSCSTTVDCSQFTEASMNVTCVEQKCLCFNQNSVEVKCSLPKSFYNNVIGGTCPCNHEHAECNPKSSICYCHREYTATNDRRRCIKKKLQLGEKCEDDAQCVYQEKFSECHLTEKVCKCQKGFVEFNDGCISTVNLDDHCESDDQCSNKTSNSICASKRCACALGFVSNFEKTQCLPGVGHDGDCRLHDQCKLVLGVGSTCYSGKCSCDIKHQLYENKPKRGNETYYTCEKEILYGDYCYEHTDCYRLGEVQSMQCFHGTCACRPDYLTLNNTCVLNGASTIKTNMPFFLIMIVVTCTLLAGALRNSIEKIYDL